MVAIRLITLTAMLLLAGCGTAGSTSAGQAGGLAQAAQTHPLGWDMLDGSVEPDATGFLIASNWCDGAGNCVARD
jgi:uncharacterized protein YceK